MPEDKLKGVHPKLAAKVNQILAAMDCLGHPMKVVQGVRTVEQQKELYAQGRTKPGKIVTNADGVTKLSNHQPKMDGWGWAVDMAFATGEMFGEKQPWDCYGECAKALGLIWGGDWVSIKDRPHIELKDSK